MRTTIEKKIKGAVRLAVLLVLCCPALALAAGTGANKAFPLRWEYPSVRTLSTAQLYQMFPRVVVVDARTRLEWKILHIQGAILDSVDGKLFGHHFRMVLRAIRRKTQEPIVFYCNGHLCPKSYIAAQRAQEAGIKDVYAYDSGIHDWTQAHPDLAVMFGHSPVTPALIIPEAEFRKHELPPQVFAGIVNKKHCDCLLI
ncbi:MAG: rhodanese-like domain-containing protein, partial [Acidiferrobacterales bacterium]